MTAHAKRGPANLQAALRRLPPADRWVVEAPVPLWNTLASLPRTGGIVFDARNKRGFPARLKGFSGAVAGFHVKLSWHGHEQDVRLLAGIFSDADEMPMWALDSLSHVHGQPGAPEIPPAILKTAQNALVEESKRIGEDVLQRALWAVQSEARQEQGNPTSRVDLQRPDNPIPHLSARVAALSAKEAELFRRTMAARVARDGDDAVAATRRELQEAQQALDQARAAEIARIEDIEERLAEKEQRMEKSFTLTIIDEFAFSWSIA